VLLMLLALAAPVHAAQKEHDFASGVKDVLGYQPHLPASKKTASALKDILARPEFQDKHNQPKGPTLMERLLQWIAKHLGGLGSGLLAAGGTALWIAVIVIAAILVLLVYWAVNRIWARMSREPDKAASPGAEENLSAQGLRDLAQKTAAAGDFRSALRYRFRSVVNELGVVDADRQTNWQLLRLVRKQHSFATKDFAELIALFEDCWYGGRTAGAEEFRRADLLATAVEKLIAPREEAA
jgi:hypothetical protein